MQSSIVIKLANIVGLIIAIIMVAGNAFSSGSSDDEWLRKPVIVKFNKEPLKNVLYEISQQTGISIIYNSDFANEEITGQYDGVEASEAITRLFKGKNKIIQINNQEKLIVLKTFGFKSFTIANANAKHRDESKQTLAELVELHSQQYVEYKDRIASDNEILGEGMTRGEIRARQEQQYKDYKVGIADSDDVEEGGYTRSEVRDLQEQQYKDYEARISNGSIEGGTMTLSQLNSMHDQQHNEYQARLNDGELHEDGGVSRNELLTMHENQYNDYKDRIEDNSIIIE